MLRRLLPSIWIGALTAPLLLFTACENGPPWRTEREAAESASPADFGATAAYERRFLFLGPGGALPTGAVFDFASLSDSVGVRRGIRARLLDEDGWVAVADEAWGMDPMREPWRLVPRGPIRLVVGDAGEVDALIVRTDDPSVRLESGAIIAEQSPDAGTQLVLRQARVLPDQDAIPGILLDEQLGRAVNPAAVPWPPGSRPAEESDSASELSPTPAPRPGVGALLSDNAGFYVVFTASAGGELAWVHSGGRDDLRRGARLEPAELEAVDQGGARLPVRWRVVASSGDLTGELVAETTDRVLLDAGDVAALGYVFVSGWIDDRGARRDVYGLIRHVR